MSTRVRPAERLAWHRGAALRDQDLADWAEYEPELLALHIRAAHATWGVAGGLDVVRSADRRAVVVSAGAAYTCSGRVIGLEAATRLAAPPGGRAVLLLVLAAVGAGRRECGGTAPPCDDARPAPLARLCWVIPEHASGCGCGRCGPQPDEVTLARMARLPDGSLGAVSYQVRPIARPRGRPSIGSGLAPAVGLGWAEGVLSLAAFVDTTEAEFATTPLYFVSLRDLPAIPPGLLGPYLSIGWPSPGGFQVTLRFAARPAVAAAKVIAQARPLVELATVSWIGVEVDTGCGPPLVAGRSIRAPILFPASGSGP